MTDTMDRNLRQLTGYLLRRATSASMPGVNRILQGYGLRRSTYSSLTVVIENPGLNQTQLADTLAIERPNVVQIIDQLEEAGLVQRQKSTEDRRAYALCPTSKGSAVQSRAFAALQRYDGKLAHGLGAGEIAELHRLLQAIEANAVELERSDDVEISRP